jgi:hypothetical protein
MLVAFIQFTRPGPDSSPTTAHVPQRKTFSLPPRKYAGKHSLPPQFSLAKTWEYKNIITSPMLA